MDECALSNGSHIWRVLKKFLSILVEHEVFEYIGNNVCIDYLIKGPTSNSSNLSKQVISPKFSQALYERDGESISELSPYN